MLLLFTGKKYVSSISLKIRIRERYAVLALAALILVGGLIPQPNIASRYHAANVLLGQRRKTLPASEVLKPSEPDEAEMTDDHDTQSANEEPH